MGSKQAIRIILDTNVVFEGMTQVNSASGLLIEAWLGGLLSVCVSDALAYEYEYVDVLSRKLNAERWEAARPALATLLARAQFITIHYSWRPATPDPGDDHIVDCAMNSGAVVVTHNQKDFRLAERELGLIVVSPLQLVAVLAQ